MSDLIDEFADFMRSRQSLPMQDFIRGQRAKLDQLAPATTRFTLEVRAQSAAISVFDFVCFGLDQNGKLADDRFMVFFNQKVAPADAIQLSELADKSALFAFDLDELPTEIARLVFTISIDGAGTMKSLGASELILKANGQAVMRYAFSGADFAQEGALMLSEIYRKDGVWRVWASGQGFAGDLGALLSHFGGEESESSSRPPTAPTLPSPVLPPTQQYLLPSLGKETYSGVIAKFLVFPGDTIVEDQSVLEIETDKAILEVPSTVNGTIKDVLVKAGDSVNVGQPIFTLEATIAANQSPPSPPVSQPAISSVPVNAATPTVIPAAPLGELQKTLDNAPANATIQLPRGEYRGPIRITRALVIEGEGAVIWAQSGPVVSVASAGVTLRGVQIEVTGDENGVALQVEGAAPTLERVGVRGRVEGLNRASGEWKLPQSLDLGAFAPRARSSWKFEIAVPVDCQLKTNVSGLQISPSRVEAGAHEIEISAGNIGPDTFLAGQIEVGHAGLVRPIPLCGRTDINAAAVQDKRI